VEIKHKDIIKLFDSEQEEKTSCTHQEILDLQVKCLQENEKIDRKLDDLKRDVTYLIRITAKASYEQQKRHEETKALRRERGYY
jgi:hypothetical protein